MAESPGLNVHPMPRLDEKYDRLVQRSLKPGGGDGTSGPMDPASREYVALSLAKAMAEVRGDFSLLNQRMGDLEKRIPSWWSILGAVMIGVGTVFAALAFAGDRFDSGLGMADKRQEQLEIDRAQNDRIEKLLHQLTLNPASAQRSSY